MLPWQWVTCGSPIRQARRPSPLLLIGRATPGDIEAYLPTAPSSRVVLEFLGRGVPGCVEAIDGPTSESHRRSAPVPFHLAATLLQLYSQSHVEPVLILPVLLHLPELLSLLPPHSSIRLAVAVDERNPEAVEEAQGMRALAEAIDVARTSCLSFPGAPCPSRGASSVALPLIPLTDLAAVVPTLQPVPCRAALRAVTAALGLSSDVLGRSPLSPGPKPQGPPRPLEGRIAFCFLTYANHDSPRHWQDFFDRAPASRYSIHCHAVNPDLVTDPFLKPHLIPSAPTRWGNFLRAYVRLLQTALADPEANRFVVVSQSCIPVRPFSEFLDALADDTPWVERGHSPPAIIHERYSNLSPEARLLIPEIEFARNEFGTWAVWPRRQAAIVAAGLLLGAFERVEANDETYPGCLLALAGEPTQHWYRPCTYVHWLSPTEPHPESFATDSPEFAAAYQRAVAGGYLSMRKVFDPEVRVKAQQTMGADAFAEATLFSP